MVLLSVEFLILLISIILIIIGKVKNKRGILTIGICIILLQILVTILLFTYLIERKQEITINSTESVIEQEELPIPDRIVVKDEEGMQTMRTLGNNMAWLLKCIEQGRKSGIEIPEKEQPIRTNYIR